MLRFVFQSQMIIFDHDLTTLISFISHQLRLVAVVAFALYSAECESCASFTSCALSPLAIFAGHTTMGMFAYAFHCPLHFSAVAATSVLQLTKVTISIA